MTGDAKSDVDIPLRENLVETAVNFLLNPSVKGKPDHPKTAFLKNKGLTDEEISVAFQRAHSQPELSPAQQQPVQQQSLTPHSQPYYLRPYSFWARLSSVSSSLIVIAVALYGLHRFYKLYIEPWLFGTKPKSDELKELITELSSSVAELKNSVSTLEVTVNSQKDQIDRVFLSEGTSYMPIPMAVADLKTEVGNLKSLLINRHQFPAVPKVASNISIPQWQLTDTDAKENNKESKSVEETTEDSTSSADDSSSSGEETSNVDQPQNNDWRKRVLETIDQITKTAEARRLNGDESQDPSVVDPSETDENGVRDVHNVDVLQDPSLICDEKK
ncbi:hypothetical protein JTE90_022407 [Oedothorax gibbosus]|uniref:Peroxisomal membrane protein PEX14 n=1 Tax=Oedothorax gibbosus TaxID=931172 RepID=A0AAV6U3Y0_9ARAC|nr:hypothetical protein JTE90_022407 [Oedothorax gibbosus]